jgi:hypothetical protein
MDMVSKTKEKTAKKIPMTGSKDMLTDKTLKVIDEIVKGMKEKQKQEIFDRVLENKKARDHVLKIMFWTYCGNDIKKDVGRRENIRAVVKKLDDKKAAQERARLAKVDE